MTSNFIAQSYGKSLNYTNIQNSLFKEYDVKKGLRNEDGTGVRVGLTRDVYKRQSLTSRGGCYRSG